MVAQINFGGAGNTSTIDYVPPTTTIVYGTAQADGTTTYSATTTDNTTMYIVAGLASFVVGYIIMRR